MLFHFLVFLKDDICSSVQSTLVMVALAADRNVYSSVFEGNVLEILLSGTFDL